MILFFFWLQRFLKFFLEKYKRHVCNADQREFINQWYILVIISDLLTISGSVLKMEIKAKVRATHFKSLVFFYSFGWSHILLRYVVILMFSLFSHP